MSSRCLNETRKLRKGKFCVNGYSYNTVYMKRDKRYMRCTKSNKLGCRARAILNTTAPSHKVTVSGPHNHPQDTNEKLAVDFLNQLKIACKSGISSSTRSIYDDVAKIFPEGAKVKPYNSLRSSMSRWKLQK